MANIPALGYGYSFNLPVFGFGVAGYRDLFTAASYPDKLCFIYNNPVDDSATVLTPSSALPTLPVSNLKNKLRTKVWRTDSETTASLIIDFTEAKFCRFIGIVGDNLSTGATVTVEFSDTGVFSDTTTMYQETYDVVESIIGYGEAGYGEYGYGGTFTNTNRKVAPPKIHFLGYNVNGDFPEHRYCKLTFTDTGNTDGYLEFGKIFVCDYYKTPYNYVYGAGYRVIDPSEVIISSGGADWGNRRNLYTSLDLSLPYIPTLSKYTDFMTMLYAVGTTENFILVLTPDSALGRMYTSFYGRFSDSEMVFTHTNVNRQALRLSFREVR